MKKSNKVLLVSFIVVLSIFLIIARTYDRNFIGFHHIEGVMTSQHSDVIVKVGQ